MQFATPSSSHLRPSLLPRYQRIRRKLQQIVAPLYVEMKDIIEIQNKAPEAILEGSGIERLTFTAQETANMLSVSTKTVYRLCSRGLLKRSPALRTLLITRSSILEFLKL